jgi:hypothetical protein
MASRAFTPRLRIRHRFAPALPKEVKVFKLDPNDEICGLTVLAIKVAIPSINVARSTATARKRPPPREGEQPLNERFARSGRLKSTIDHPLLTLKLPTLRRIRRPVKRRTKNAQRHGQLSVMVGA